jgi:O-antigen ligase
MRQLAEGNSCVGGSIQLATYLQIFLVLMPMIILPLFFGGVQPWVWSAVAGVFAAGMAIMIFLDEGLFSLKDIQKKWAIVIGGILVYPLLQMLPLPRTWLSLISPQRELWLDRAGEIVGMHGWTSLSYVPLNSFSGWLWWIFLAGFALLLKRMLRNAHTYALLFRILFFVAGLEALYGLLQVLIPSMGVFGINSGPEARGTFLNRDHYAAFLGMLWPLLMARLLTLDTGRSSEHFFSSEKDDRRQARQKQFFLALILGLVLLSLFFSQSRAGILCSLVVLTVFVVFWPGAKRWIVFLVAVSWILMVIYGSFIGFGAILERFETLENDAGTRLQIWRDSCLLIRDHPLAGAGLGSYQPVIFLYQQKDTDELQIGDAHNDYLQLAAEMGLPFGAAIALLIWGYWWFTAIALARRKVFMRKNSPGVQFDERILITLGALAGAAGFLFHSWVEFNWQIPANQLYFVVLLVLLGQDRVTLKRSLVNRPSNACPH